MSWEVHLVWVRVVQWFVWMSAWPLYSHDAHVSLKYRWIFIFFYFGLYPVCVWERNMHACMHARMKALRGHALFFSCPLFLRSRQKCFKFTFMHLADTFIKSDLHCIEGIRLISSCILWKSNPWDCCLLHASCSTVWPTGNLSWSHHN